MGKLTGIIEMLLVFGGVLGILVWQLVSLKKSESDARRKADEPKQR